ncbi:hypothetical protein VTL71DRAFT_598 [Oculimacula yallundae]|uniref:Uncharacterized protein n=1 Tax=Oculimacula yallundae TaxID=86028 RepID=A0ABR4D0I3_9HELO
MTNDRWIRDWGPTGLAGLQQRGAGGIHKMQPHTHSAPSLPALAESSPMSASGLFPTAWYREVGGGFDSDVE